VFNQEIFATFDLRNQHARISAPTLVITGGEDFICGPVCADEIAAGVRDAQKVILGDAGHFIFVEQPQAFYSEVARFLSGP
jgi:proline iminopeptidase